MALGTRQGVVKRVVPEILSKDSWDVIRLDDGDELVGAVELADEALDVAFVTSDAQLLRYSAGAVRPQGRSGGGVAGVKLSSGAQVIWFGTVDPRTDEVVTISGSSAALPGTQVGSTKVTPLSVYPAKGRATGGVRCHRFLKGEDTLLLAAIGPAPLLAAADSGSPVELPGVDSRRDGSGTPASQPITMAAGRGRPASESTPSTEETP